MSRRVRSAADFVKFLVLLLPQPPRTERFRIPSVRHTDRDMNPTLFERLKSVCLKIDARIQTLSKFALLPDLTNYFPPTRLNHSCFLTD